MQFILRKCSNCRRVLKIPAGRPSVLCLYCGLLVQTGPSECHQPSSSFRRIVSYVLLGILFMAALSLLVSARLISLGLDCLLYLLRRGIGWLVAQPPAQLPHHRALNSHHVLTKANNHHIISKIAQSKES